MSEKIIDIKDFEFREEVGDPFIIRMHHVDNYPKSDGKQGVKKEDLEGKNIGEDFDHDSDFRMYYGKDVPGFPVHPHRGFETITIVLDGVVDHFDSQGLKGRYSKGDVQWMTAGEGMQHSEMFPLVHDGEDNRMELFQVWLNLPNKDKMCKSYYKMLWDEDIPVVKEETNGRNASIRIISGSYKGKTALDPNPNSWANDRSNNVNIWLIDLEKGASFDIPKISKTLNRKLYLYKGGDINIDGEIISNPKTITLDGDSDIKILNKNKKSSLLLLEGEPIGEPVVNYGPFVMTSMDEIEKAYKDFKKDQFGGWPWDRRDPINTKEDKRFASYGEERIVYPREK